MQGEGRLSACCPGQHERQQLDTKMFFAFVGER